MVHKCKYFLRDSEGVLRCTQCGKSAHSEDVIEDKMVTAHEDKYIFPPESKRVGRPKKMKRAKK